MNKLQEIKRLSNDLSLLYVEDDIELQKVVHSYLSKLFDDIRVAKDGEDGLEQYKQRGADIILTDILMPNLNGIEMLKEIKSINPNQKAIILSAYTESEYFIDAIKIGIFSYIIKPLAYEQFNDVLYEIVNQISLEKELKKYHQELENLVDEQISAYKDLQEQRVEDYKSILLALVNMIETRDSYTAGHSQRVANYSRILAKHMGFSDEECDLVYRAGILHDIGKIATPDTILLKPDSLSNLEYNLIKEHVAVGVSMLKKISYFEPLTKIIIAHHERYDGKGYPNALKAEEIPPLSRIMIVADAFDAMTTSRIYRHKKSIPEALEELKRCTNAQFHPEVVKVALEVLKDIKIDEKISQYPTTTLEEERFAYFYKDRVTSLHNLEYLSIILLKNSYKYPYKFLRMISLHKFKDYNEKEGWEEGDKLLSDVAKNLSNLYPDTLAFRIHANDFIFLCATPFDTETSVYNALFEVNARGVSFSILDINLEAQNIYSIKLLEKAIHSLQTKENR